MEEIRKIIFDTDLGGDCDDVMALDLLLSAHRAKECRLLGVSSSLNVRTAVRAIYSILLEHGCENIPIARMPLEGEEPKSTFYCNVLASTVTDPDAPDYSNAPDAVPFLRKTLAENKDVILLATGPLTNIAALLQSGPDEISPLNGLDLVRTSVKELVLMGGDFSHQTGIYPYPEDVLEDGSLKPRWEWNIYCDADASRKVFELCPVPLTALPFEAAHDLLTGGPMRRRGEGKLADSLAYTSFGAMDGRDSWDPMTALYAVYGARPWFYRTAPGRIVIDENAVSRYYPDPEGKHSFLECALPREEVGKAIDDLVMRLFA